MSVIEREAVMLSIARTLNASLTLETAVARVLELIGEAIGADAVSIFITAAEGQEANDLQVSFARFGGAMERGAVSIGLGISGYVLDTGEPVMVDDVADEPRYEGKLDIEFGTRTRALIAVPMRRREGLNGLIEGIRERPEPFGEGDLQFLMAVGDELAVAVENARLIEQLQKDVRERELLLDAARAVGGTLDLDQVLSVLLTTLAELVPYDAVGVYLLDSETGKFTDVQHRGYPPDVATRLNEEPGTGITGWVARHKTSVNAGRVKEDPRYIEVRPSTRSEVAVPIRRADDVIGVITAESDVGEAYSDRQVGLMEIFAGHVASAITNARLYQRDVERSRLDHELELAREIQAAALPVKHLSDDRVDVMGVNVAADVVGGDYFDYFWAEEGRLRLALADVSGHGLSASLLMSAVRSAVRFSSAEAQPAALATRLNRLLYESTPANQYVAAVLADLDTDSGHFVYSNGGHAPPLRIGANVTEPLDSTGLIIGAFADAVYEERSVDLDAGDLIVFYTDGLTEMANLEGEEFGLERLCGLISDQRERPVSDIIAAVRSDARAFRGARRREDDVTLMLLRWRG